MLFKKEHYFLSSFYPCDIYYCGLIFPSAENAFQAAKCTDPSDVSYFVTCTPKEAKNRGKSINTWEYWGIMRVVIMRNLIREKFSDPVLAKLLDDTQNIRLVEHNYWHDYFWGVCNGNGKNCLGKLLMEIRRENRTKFAF